MFEPVVREPVELSFTTNTVVEHYLKQLQAKGLHGNSVEEVIERIVTQSLDDFLRKGILAQVATVTAPEQELETRRCLKCHELILAGEKRCPICEG